MPDHASPIHSPIDVAMHHTLQFVAQELAPGAAIVEVGCGDGQLAAALIARGFAVTAIDSDADAVARARRLGVPAIRADWPGVDTEPTDAVLFTRSLHHVHDLPAAVQEAAAVLRAGGRVLVEDFEYRAVDQGTIDWFCAVVRETADRDLFSVGSHGFATRILAATDPARAWREDHDHDLHDFDTIRRAIADAIPVRRTDAVPYLYRYLIAELQPTAAAVARAVEVQAAEADAILVGSIAPVGRRVVAG